MRLQITIVLFLMTYGLFSQEYASVVIRNDSLAESGNALNYYNNDILIQSRNTCFPLGQSCGMLRSFDNNLISNWELLLPLTKPGNENTILLRDSTIYYLGRNNIASPERGYYSYKISHTGNVIDFERYPLECEFNFLQGAYIKENNLFLYGTSDKSESSQEIDVNGVLVNFDITTNELESEYFDYGNLFVDVWDLQKSIDDSLVFFSKRRRQGSFSERDLVIEKILPDGSRVDLYTMMVENDDISQLPNMTVLSNGNIAFQILDGNMIGNFWRVISNEGDFLFDINFSASIFHPDRLDVYDISNTADGGFLAIGRYVDLTDIQGGIGREDNGMLMKISEAGNMEWVRSYRNTHEDTGDYAESSLSAAIELPNGDIVATGSARQESSDLWILKVDSNGCLGEDECGELTTAVEDIIIKKSPVFIYPNPLADEQLTIDGLDSKGSESYDIVIRDILGAVILERNNIQSQKVQFTDFEGSGVFILSIYKNGKIIHSEKVIKL